MELYIIIEAVSRKEQSDRYGELRSRYFISIIICSLAQTSIAPLRRHSLKRNNVMCELTVVNPNL